MSTGNKKRIWSRNFPRAALIPPGFPPDVSGVEAHMKISGILRAALRNNMSDSTYPWGSPYSQVGLEVEVVDIHAPAQNDFSSPSNVRDLT